MRGRRMISCSGRPCGRACALVAIALATTLAVIYTASREQQPWCWLYFGSQDNLDFRRRVADQLEQIHRELSHRSTDAPLLIRLQDVIWQLDPRTRSPEDPTLHPDTCEEEYLGSLSDRPFHQHNFRPRPNCGRPLHELLTVVLVSEASSVEPLLRAFRDLQLAVVAAVAGPVHSRHKDVSLIQVKPEQFKFPGRLWNLLVAEAKTPYVLIARDLASLNWYARFERQINVISNSTNVGIAGGAFRNSTGHWKAGCFQTNVRNYAIKYWEGYRYSHKDCMFCDYVDGPFVAKTSIIRKYPLNEKMPKTVLFHDWFLRLKHVDVVSVVCPDVMYFTHGPNENGLVPMKPSKERNNWLKFGKAWEIVDVHLPDRKFEFTCKELEFDCRPASWTKTYLLPPCCVKQVSTSLKVLHEFATQRELEYEIEAGLLVGAVKLRGYLPWDRDGDASYLTKDHELFLSEQKFFSDRGCPLGNFEKHEYFRIYTPDNYIEMWGGANLSTQFLPVEMRGTPTLVEVDGVWVRGQTNPGLYARNRYGPGILRHAQWWGYLGKSTSWEQYEMIPWIPCARPSHHSCLEHYSLDGSWDFARL